MMFSNFNQSNDSKRQAFLGLQAPSIWALVERVLARPELRDFLFLRSVFESLDAVLAHLPRD
jgi:hypothetical protein